MVISLMQISLFEELVENTIEATKDIPETVAATGKISMSRKKIMMSVGELFILRISIPTKKEANEISTSLDLF